MITPITARQAKIYRLWQQNQSVKATARALNLQPEDIRRTIARVKTKLAKGQKLPEET